MQSHAHGSLLAPSIGSAPSEHRSQGSLDYGAEHHSNRSGARSEVLHSNYAGDLHSHRSSRSSAAGPPSTSGYSDGDRAGGYAIRGSRRASMSFQDVPPEMDDPVDWSGVGTDQHDDIFYDGDSAYGPGSQAFHDEFDLKSSAPAPHDYHVFVANFYELLPGKCASGSASVDGASKAVSSRMTITCAQAVHCETGRHRMVTERSFSKSDWGFASESSHSHSSTTRASRRYKALYGCDNRCYYIPSLAPNLVRIDKNLKSLWKHKDIAQHMFYNLVDSSSEDRSSGISRARALVREGHGLHADASAGRQPPSSSVHVGLRHEPMWTEATRYQSDSSHSYGLSARHMHSGFGLVPRALSEGREPVTEHFRPSRPGSMIQGATHGKDNSRTATRSSSSVDRYNDGLGQGHLRLGDMTQWDWQSRKKCWVVLKQPRREFEIRSFSEGIEEIHMTFAHAELLLSVMRAHGSINWKSRVDAKHEPSGPSHRGPEWAQSELHKAMCNLAGSIITVRILPTDMSDEVHVKSRHGLAQLQQADDVKSSGPRVLPASILPGCLGEFARKAEDHLKSQAATGDDKAYHPYTQRSSIPRQYAGEGAVGSLWLNNYMAQRISLESILASMNNSGGGVVSHHEEKLFVCIVGEGRFVSFILMIEKVMGVHLQDLMAVGHMHHHAEVEVPGHTTESGLHDCGPFIETAYRIERAMKPAHEHHKLGLSVVMA